MALERKLAYKDRYIIQLVEVVNESVDPDALATFPDQTTPVELTVSWTQEEYTRILSALCVGAELAFPYQAQQIYYDFLKLLNGGSMSCEDIADCIETSDDITIQLAIINSRNNINRVDPVVADETLVTDPSGIGATKLEEPISEIDNCYLDPLWGGIRNGIVARLDDNARNFLEVIVARADLAERVQEAINLIPVFGTMLVAVIEQVTELAPDMLNLYNAFSSQEELDNIACYFFDLGCAECRYPTYNELFEYYASAGITGMDSIETLVLQAATDYLTGSTVLAAIAFYHTMIAYQLFILYLETKFGSASGTKQLTEWAVLAEDTGDNDWATLCDGCNEDYVLWTWDFRTQGQGEFYQDTVQTGQQGVFEAGLGWRCVNFSTGRRFVVAFKFDPTWEVRAVAMLVTGDTGNSWSWVRRPTWGSTSGQTSSSAGAANLPDWTRYWDGYASVTGINEVYFFTQWTGQTAVAHLAKVSFLFNVGHAPTENSIPTNDLTPYA